MFIIRWFLGRLILLLNFIFTPKKRKRPQGEQTTVDAATQYLALYQYKACPFCVKVRRSMRKQGLNIVLLDAKQAPHKDTLLIKVGMPKFHAYGLKKMVTLVGCMNLQILLIILISALHK